MAQQDQYYIWLGHFVEDLSYNNLPEQRWTCSCSSCTKSYQSAITIWQRTNYSTQLLLIKLSTLHRSLDRDEESSRVLEEFLCHVRRLDWRVGRIRSDNGSKYVTKLQPPNAMTLRYSRWWSLNLKNLNSRWMARKSMASSSVSTIRWMRWRTRSITAWWPQIFFWKYVYRHLNWIY